MFADLRRECAAQLVELDADGYAIGGLSVGEPRPLSLEMVEATEPLLPRDRPRYAMGVGMPEELPEYVARGVDMMDCVLPSRNARNGCLFTSQGRVHHQDMRAIRTTRGPSTRTALAILAGTIAGLTCATCFRRGKCCTRYWLRGTICGATLTSCVRSGTLSYWANSPNI